LMALFVGMLVYMDTASAVKSLARGGRLSM
jgi:hypothetical protein